MYHGTPSLTGLQYEVDLARGQFHIASNYCSCRETFSASGQVVTAKRNRLDTKKVTTLVLPHEALPVHRSVAVQGLQGGAVLNQHLQNFSASSINFSKSLLRPPPPQYDAPHGAVLGV